MRPMRGLNGQRAWISTLPQMRHTWMEPPKTLVTSRNIENNRVHQALDTEAGIMLTACPFCSITLNDSVKSFEKGDVIQVMDITELIVSAL